MSHTMSFGSPRTSMFMFQSSVHSTRLLRCLDEQRQKDILCDMTVVVGDRSFRAHRSVLAACSDYFLANIGSQAGQGLIVTLPSKVTVEGFDPLLEFAYTAKLLFTKENIQEIRKCAAILRFRNLDKACFEFLLPKFFNDGESAQMVYRKSRWKKRCYKQNPSGWKSSSGVDNDGDEDGEQEHSDSECPEGPPPRERKQSSYMKTCVDAGRCCSSASDKQETTCPVPCLKNCNISRKEQTYVKNCPGLSDKTSSSDGPSVRGDIEETLQSWQCRNKSCPDQEKHEKGDDVEPKDPKGHCEIFSAGSSRVTEPVTCGGPMRSKGVEINNCSLRFCETLCPVPMAGHESAHKRSEYPLARVSPCREGDGGRTSVEREVAEHLADMCSTQPEPCLPSRSADICWMTRPPHLDPGRECPLLRDLRIEEAQSPACEEQCLAKMSPCGSSAQSGDDSEFDTEGEGECCIAEGTYKVQTPLSVDQIASLNRNDFQRLLKQGQLTQAQLDFVHDARRRSKNRIAAQRCRKRKLDCIHNLEWEIDKLRSEREKLLEEQNYLTQLKIRTHQSLSDLCQRVCREARPHQLEAFAKYSSPECPMAVLIAQMSSPPLAPGAQDQGGPFQDVPDTTPTNPLPTGPAAYTHSPTQPSKPNASQAESYSRVGDEPPTKHCHPNILGTRGRCPVDV